MAARDGCAGLLRSARNDSFSSCRFHRLLGEWLAFELQAVDRLQPIHTAQMLSYLKLGGFRLGLLLNFNVLHMRNGIKRVLNGY